MWSAALSTTVCDMVSSFVFFEPVLVRPLFPDGIFSTSDPFLNFASSRFCFPFGFQIGAVRRLSGLLLGFIIIFGPFLSQ
jgi:hypothetical protein